MRRMYFQTLSTSRGFQSGTSTTLTFGLGNSNHIDSVLVSWNSLDMEVFEKVGVGQKTLLEKGKGKPSRKPKRKFESVLTFADIDLDWKHEEKINH